jgi:predicted DNA-binding transcriptional regulator YafY
LRQYRKYCDEAFLLEIQYQAPRDNTGQRVNTLMLEPHEVMEKRGKLFLLGLEQRTYEKKMINLERIVDVRQLPSKMKRSISEMTVRFELYGRLAETYRPYGDEKIIFRTAARIQVKAQVRETSGLISRLLKYGSACQVLSPAMVREAMRDRIEAMYGVLKDQSLEAT